MNACVLRQAKIAAEGDVRGRDRSFTGGEQLGYHDFRFRNRFPERTRPPELSDFGAGLWRVLRSLQITQYVRERHSAGAKPIQHLGRVARRKTERGVGAAVYEDPFVGGFALDLHFAPKG